MTFVTLAHHLPAAESTVWRIALHAFDHVVVWVVLAVAVGLAARWIARALARRDETRPA